MTVPLVASMAERGYLVSLRDGRLTVRAKAGRVPAETLAEVREHKVEILAALAAEEGALAPREAQSPAPAPERSPTGDVDGLDPRQVAAAEMLREWGAAGGPEREERAVAIELPDGLGIVHVLPERTGAPRCEVTWRELAADPLGTLAGVRAVLGAVREFQGRIVAGRR